MSSQQGSTSATTFPVRGAGLPYDWRRGLLGALAWLIAAQLSQFYSFAGTAMAAFWPPDGIAVGLVLAYGWRMLPPIGCAVLFFHYLRGSAPESALLGCFALLLALSVVLYLVRRDRRRHRHVTPVTAMMRYHCLTVIPAVLILSLVGSWQFALQAEWPDILPLMLAMAVSDGLGILLFARFSELAAYELENRRSRIKIGRNLELSPVWFWLVGLVVLALVIQHAAVSEQMRNLMLPMRYLVFVLITWAAYQGQPFFVYLATAVAAAVLMALTPDIVRNDAWRLLDHTLLVGSVAVLGFLALATMQHRRQVEERLRQATQRNPLTGWFNEQGLGQMLERASCRSSLVGVDIQNFKRIVELLGLLSAREIEKHVAGLLEEHTPEASVFAHPNEGFFIILLPADADVDDCVARIETLLSERRYSYGTYSIRLQLALGVLPLFELQQDESPEDTLASLMLACQMHSLWYEAPPVQATRAQDEQTPLPELILMRRNQLFVLEDLREMLQRPPGSPSSSGLWLACQKIEPIQPEGKHGVEILLRWTLSDGSQYMPDAFLPLAERYGLMPRLDRWVVRHALMMLAADRPEPYQLGKVGLNLSGASVIDPRLFEFIERTILSSQLPPSLFCFEITETTQINEHEAAVLLLKQLRALGCHTSLDDFGTGVASFDYLKSLPLDYVKIDGSFIRNLLTSSVDHEIVKAICDIAHTMQLKTVAEFVETPEHLALLRQWGVDYAQGYGIGKPEYLGSYLTSLRLARS